MDIRNKVSVEFDDGTTNLPNTLQNLALGYQRAILFTYHESLDDLLSP